jgi:hypothetical protein
MSLAPLSSPAVIACNKRHHHQDSKLGSRLSILGSCSLLACPQPTLVANGLRSSERRYLAQARRRMSAITR